jgi:hypothetical protein
MIRPVDEVSAVSWLAVSGGSIELVWSRATLYCPVAQPFQFSAHRRKRNTNNVLRRCDCHSSLFRTLWRRRRDEEVSITQLFYRFLEIV